MVKRLSKPITKWLTPQDNIESGDIVLLRDTDTPWLAWVLETFKGKNGKVRSIKILTKGNVFVRPISKIVKFIKDDLDLDDQTSQRFCLK